VKVNSTLEVNRANSRKVDGQSDRDVRLGTLLLWTGCLSAAFWVWSVLQVRAYYQLIDLVPLPIYASLTCAGGFLIFHHTKRPVA
jgi:hypothetical protein